MIEPDELKAVEAARRGDLDHLGRLYQRYYRTLVWLAFSILADRDLAEDAAQESFAQACRALDSLRDPSRFASWLAAICRHVACQMARQRKRLQGVSQLPRYVVSSPGQDNGQVEVMVSQALGRMDPASRELLILHYYNQMSYERIAAILDIPPQRVKSRLFRARRKMAICLDRLGFQWDWQ
ncbi:MAG: sigma-70 family RNA polymerase sigma factor [Sedimentisphaerales bacterium]|nr:sigma-70 family RNA polymerase sigma factor [Sedimentisphaerales bacterium]